jgi:flagellar biosynthesis/type III secretory pathway protein FliH
MQDSSIDDKPAPLSEEALASIKSEAFEAGMTAGEKRALDAYAQEKKQFMENWAHLTEGLAQAKSEMLEQLQSCLPDLLIEGIGQILEAWDPSPDQVTQVVNDLLDSCDLREGNPVVVFLNPQSIQQLQSHQIDFNGRSGLVELMDDRHLKAGECRVEGRFGMVDAKYATKLRNLHSVLTDK